MWSTSGCLTKRKKRSYRSCGIISARQNCIKLSSVSRGSVAELLPADAPSISRSDPDPDESAPASGGAGWPGNNALIRACRGPLKNEGKPHTALVKPTNSSNFSPAGLCLENASRMAGKWRSQSPSASSAMAAAAAAATAATLGGAGTPSADTPRGLPGALLAADAGAVSVGVLEPAEEKEPERRLRARP